MNTTQIFMPSLNRIERIVVVMLENRSFDHTLGYLSLDKYGRTEVDGLKDDAAWNKKVASFYNGNSFPPWKCGDPFNALPGDPPHERSEIATQLGNKLNGVFSMHGFVTNYASVAPVAPTDQPPVMSYFTPDEIPVTHFLAENYAICDRWFSSLPAGTQPNRLMAMSGYSAIEVNTHMLPEQHLVYDWLDEREVRWCVYHESMPFFSLMPGWIPEILSSDNFRDFNELDNDLMQGLPEDLPEVFFIEPTYTDAPHVGPSSDDHAPTAVKAGQEFLMKVYRAFMLNPDLWAKTVMIITYDEHGGFFDHVPPIDLVTQAPVGVAYPKFETSGVRVPAMVVSPLVKPGTVFHGNLDHTSILKFIGQVFGGGSYSPEVDARPVGSVLDVLNLEEPRQKMAAPPQLNDYLAKAVASVGYTPGKAPHNEIAKSFKTALDEMQNQNPPQTARKFGKLMGKF